MPSSATVTGKTGPGSTVTALVLNNVVEMLVLPAPSSVLQFKYNGGTSISQFDMAATTTFTVTVSAGVITVTISQ